MGQQAQQNYLQSLGQTAAAQAQQAGLQFESESGKQQQLLGLAQGQFQGGMALDQSLFEQQQAAAGAVQNAKSAIWSGIGGVASTIGGGLTQMRNQQDNLAMLGQIYGGGKKTNELTGNLLLGPTGQNMINPLFAGQGFQTNLIKVNNPFENYNSYNKEFYQEPPK